jgi:chromosome segregation ATPase
MDTKEAMQLETRVMSEVRKLINAKFNTGSEELSSDSKLAVQQLGGAVSAIRDELTKTHSSFRLISVTIDDVNHRMGLLGNELKDARVLKDIEDLKLAVNKLWDHITATDSTNRLGVLEKAIADVVNRMGAIERVASMPVKKNPAEVHSANVDHAAIHDVTARMGDVLTQLQGVKIQVDDVTQKLSVKEQGAGTDSSLRERLLNLESVVDSIKSSPVQTVVNPEELSRVQLDELKTKLDNSEKLVADLDSRFKAYTTLSLNQISVNSNGARVDGVADVTGVEPRLEALESKVNGNAPAHSNAASAQNPPPANFDFVSTIDADQAAKVTLQDLRHQITDMCKQLIGVNSALGESNTEVGVLKGRLVKLELTVASLTTAMIDAETTRHDVQKVEIDLLKERLDRSEKHYVELEIKVKLLSTLVNSSVSAVAANEPWPQITTDPKPVGAQLPLQATNPPVYDPQIQQQNPVPVPTVAPAAQPEIQSAFSPFSFKFNP